MLKYIAIRLLTAIPVLFFVILITFTLVRLAPGGPFDEERAVPPQVLENLNKRYHLDDPITVQFKDYVLNLLQGDFGPSYKYPTRTVTELIATGLPTTIELGLYALLFAACLGILSGVIAGLKPNTLQDYVPMSIAMIGICLPSFVLGPLLILSFGIGLEWFPVSGWGVSSGDKVLPAITLGAAYAAYIARLTRGGMLEVMSQDYIRTARAKGVSKFKVVVFHALRGALTPVVAFAGPAAAGLLSGSFVVETIYQIPGLGRFYLQAAFNRDYTMILGTTIFFASLIILFNFLADILQAWMNPKLRQSLSK
ncbi:ABC transporter permease [Teredinibacter franksiae]|uniref:ABC transporter permease n=1 Tax=Teredinibacter franksiae TaxID=2761453 RepID=UPI0016296451|nr:ABC transporter permease subunit [Teredinibacter franksiae]